MTKSTKGMLVLFAMAVALLQFSSCRKDKVKIEDKKVMAGDCPDTVSYQQTIQPLINMNCATSGCHASGAGGYTFTTHNSVSNNSAIILRTMRHEPGVSQMPQGQAKLPDSLIQQFMCWEAQGKLNN